MKTDFSSSFFYIFLLVAFGIGSVVLVQSDTLTQTEINNDRIHGSEVVAAWYEARRTSPLQSIESTVDNQIAGLGYFLEDALAAAGVTISSFDSSVRIDPGMRREEIAEILAAKLGWDEADKNYFARLGPLCYVNNYEGQFAPGRYRFAWGTTPDQAAALMRTQFNNRMRDILLHPNQQDPIVQSALIVASLLQREAAGDGDEREIAGIIWNRMYADMKLQLDATLQYAKGRPGDWWPIPEAEDKFIDSPYNTYQINGLPPGPIANPSTKMIMAALNPIPTDCYYYLHAEGEFYCSPDYKGHLRNIDRYL